MAAAIKRAEEAAKAARLQADEATAATKKAEVRAAMLAPLAGDCCCDQWCVLLRIRVEEVFRATPTFMRTLIGSNKPFAYD
jgi:hypothetical protein